jgi:hypothetical protein
MRPNQTKNGSQEPVLVQFGFGFFWFRELDFKTLMQLLASSCAANASSLLVTRFLIFSATDGNFVFSKVVGIATGASPFINSNDVWI